MQQYRQKRRRQTMVLLVALVVLVAAALAGWWMYKTLPGKVSAWIDAVTVSPEEKTALSEAFSRRLVHNFPHLAHDSLLYFGAPNYTFDTWARQAKNEPRLFPIVQGREDAALKQKLREMIASYPPQFKPHLYYYYPEDRTFVDIDAYAAVPAASVIKLPVLLAYFHTLDQDIIQWDTPLLYMEFHRSGGAGGMQYGETGVTFPSREIAQQMIQVSDNTATNIMISYLGGTERVNRFLREGGMRATQIRNWLPDLPGTNTISAYEMAVILQNIDSGMILSRQSRERALEILKGTHNWRLLAAPLPRHQKDFDFAHKTGDIGRALADVGIVYMPDGRKYVVAMQVDRPYNDYTARDMIQQASQIIYNHVAATKPVPQKTLSLELRADRPAKAPADTGEFLPVDEIDLGWE